ncbi:uncharacterized protein LOC112345545 [Selaginella moellendorffii]|nr:uncharacterized protein LOC112345545 [Selaginella moellendorffii]|eukprot:XP_024528309.1 uncharacterized protein LOC112345545 [Selaginella moellendorffii]
MSCSRCFGGAALATANSSARSASTTEDSCASASSISSAVESFAEVSSCGAKNRRRDSLLRDSDVEASSQGPRRTRMRLSGTSARNSSARAVSIQADGGGAYIPPPLPKNNDLEE